MKNTWKSIFAAVGLAACTSETGEEAPNPGNPDDADTDASQVTETNCTYPAGANEVMTLGDVLLPYGWNRAIHRSDGRDGTIDLEQVPCNTDDDIDWSPFDVLLFVSIPAW